MSRGRACWWAGGPLLVLAALALGVLVNLTSCVRTVRPPPAPRDPVTVHVAEYGKHASLLLPAGEDRLVEWSWGDWNYFALNRTRLRDGAAALFWSESSTLARRAVDDRADAEALRVALGASELISLPVERERAAALLAGLTARYERGRASEIWNPVAGRYFVRDAARYWMFDNSVHELSRWLRALDVEVRGVSLLGEFRPAPGSSATAVGSPDEPHAVRYLFR